MAKLCTKLLAISLTAQTILGDVDGLHASDRQPVLVVDSPCAGLTERVRGQLSDQPVRVTRHGDFTDDGQQAFSSLPGETFHARVEPSADGTRLVVSTPAAAPTTRVLAVTLTGCSSDALEVLALALRAELVAALTPAPAAAASSTPERTIVEAAAVPLRVQAAPEAAGRVRVYGGARGLRPLPDVWAAGVGVAASLERWPLRGLVGAELHGPRTLERPAAALRVLPGVLEAQAGYGVLRWRGGTLHAVAGLGITLLGRRTTATSPAYGATARDVLTLPHALAGMALAQHGWGRLSVALGVGLRVPLAHPDFVLEDTGGGTTRVARTGRVVPWLALDLGLRIRGAPP